MGDEFVTAAFYYCSLTIIRGEGLNGLQLTGLQF
jgi:hypothetical protein